MTSTVEHARGVRAVDAHFAQRASRAQTARLRAHLPTCAACKRRYERHLLLSSLDPRAPSAEDRLASGLGIAPRAPRGPARWGVGMLLLAAATAFALWWPGVGGRFHPTGEPTARGDGHVQASLLIYRVGAGAATALVGTRIRRDDELAFAYANPGGRRYLLVYGVDEHGHVYWFHPAWPVGAPPPAAVDARPGPGPHELAEAVRHRFDGRWLRVSAVLADERLGVDDIERDGRALSGSPGSASPSVQVVNRTLEIAP